MSSFYDKYRNYGVMPAAIPAVTILLIVAITGIVFNTLTIIITIFSNYVMYTGKNFDSILTCYNFMVVPLIGLNIGMGLIFFTAVDRLITMIFPLQHPQFNKLLYLGSMFAMCLGCNAYILYIGHLNAEENKDVMVVCLIIEALHGSPGITWVIIACGYVLGAVFIYILIGIINHFVTQAENPTKKLYKSLFILCVIFTVSWIFSCACYLLCRILNLSDEISFFVPLYIGITINIACASNFFVLTKYSVEYRTAARKFFRKFNIHVFSSKTTTISSTVKST